MHKKRRTKKQKLAARQRLFENRLPTKKVKQVKKTMTIEAKSWLAYDWGLIRADLTKTLILSILAVVAIVAIYFFKIF